MPNVRSIVTPRTSARHAAHVRGIIHRARRDMPPACVNARDVGARLALLHAGGMSLRARNVATRKKPQVSLRLKGGDYLLFRFRSTIGVIRFNFSVRNGKRWSPYAVFALISFQKRTRPEAEKTQKHQFHIRSSQSFCFLRNFRAISTARLCASPRLHLRPIDVVVCDGPWNET